MRAPVIEKRFHDANPVAKLNRKLLSEAGILTVSLNGGPGCGKTLLIETTISGLLPDVPVGVIACDVATHLDADRMLRKSEQVVQVNTGPDSAADATHIHDAIQWLDLKTIKVLFIENVGTLASTASIDFGQNVTAAMFSVAGGHDKADKHPELVKSADIVLLNKTDLLHAVPFDLKAFRADVHRLNAHLEMFELSAFSGAGFDRWLDWLRARVGKDQSGTSTWFG